MKIEKSFKITAAAFSVIFAFGVLFPAQAQETATPQQQAENFYKWYIGELNKDKEPLKDKKAVKKYVSKRLVKWLYSKEYEEYGADYFLDAQDWDKDWVNNVSAAESIAEGKYTTLEVTFKGEATVGENILKVRLVKENGAWKIDRVNEQF